MKYLIFIFSSFVSLTVLGQKTETFESTYSYQVKLNIPGLEMLKEDIYASSEITVFNNGTLVLIAMEPFKTNVPGITMKGGNEKRDTLLYETGKKIAYNLYAKEAFHYNEFSFKFLNNTGDTIVSTSTDTSIILAKHISNKVTAIPRLKPQPYGMLEYKTEKTTIKLLGYKKSEYDIGALLKRVKSFKVSDTPFQWTF